MKILSNDYESNLPHLNKISQGGTANFSSILSDFLIKSGHEWIGFNIKFSEKKKSPLLLWKKGARSFWQITLSKSLSKEARDSSKHLDFKEFFKKEIDAIADFIETTRPDLIFLNGAYLTPWLILQAGAKIKIPVVVQHAGLWKKELEFARSFYTKKSLNNFIGLEKDFSKLCAFEIFLNKRSKNIYWEEIAQTDDKKTAIIALPVLIQNSKAITKTKTSSCKNIGMVARWDKIKNHEAMLALAKKGRETGLPWTFHCVTSIPDTKIDKKFKDEYQKFVAVESPKNKADLTKFYKRMDMLILPSHFETASYVTVESIFNGTPVLISPNIGWVDDFKSAGAKDWIINFKNAKSVIARIKILQNMSMPKELIENLKTKCESKTCLKQYLSIFENIKK